MHKATDNADLYVLAGGQSSRFGSDKALADIDGLPMLRDIIDRLKTSRHRVTLVTGRTQRYQSFGYPTITDQPVGIGPMGGLRAALSQRLADVGEGWLLLASCDLIQPNRDWALRLEQLTASTDSPVIAYRGAYWEPMLAMYHTDLLPLIDEQIDQKRYGLQSLLKAAKARPVDLPCRYSSLPQANTPEQLTAARKQPAA